MKRCRYCSKQFPYNAKKPNQAYCSDRCRKNMKNEMERRRSGATLRRPGYVGMNCLLCGRRLAAHGVTEFCARSA